MSLEAEIIERIRPSKEEFDKVKSSADKLMTMVNNYLRTNGIEAKTCFVGSFAKGTFLTNNDLDLFVKFPMDFPEREMEDICLKMGEELIDGERAYAEHPYSSGEFEGLDVDLVPCYDIDSTEHLMTPVDRSPFHTKYVLSKVDDAMCDQIRLTKRFMKGIGTYGAEPDVRGFSGYLCEILTIKFGGFRGLIEQGRNWDTGTVIVIEEKGPDFSDPLVVYDPVDRRRNVASAVHEDTLRMFRVACNAYLKSPSVKFFFPNKREPLSRDELRTKADEKGLRLLTAVFDRPDIILENMQAQVWKTEYALAKKLNLNGFITDSAVHRLDEKDFTIVFALKNDTLPKVEKHMGPPVNIASSKLFLERWKDNPYGEPFQENGRWYVMSERMFPDAVSLLTKGTASAGIGRDVDPDSQRLYNHQLSLEGTDQSLLTDLLDPIPPWEV